MIAYDWNCKTVDVHPQEEGETDVVYNVHWIVTGVDEDYSASRIGTQVVPLNEGGTFVPFEDLTNDVVVEWTKEALGEEQVAQVEASIARQIEDQKNPVSVTMTIGE